MRAHDNKLPFGYKLLFGPLSCGALLIGALLLALATSTLAADRVPLNVVIILADDLGWSDLGCYGADLHETPELDRLAAGGLRFTQAYAPAPVCTPTRASLLTGKHPARLNMTIWSEGSLKGPTDRLLWQARSLHDLPHQEVTLAEHLQQAGYLTALVGKWHLGDANHAAETQGFDVNIGGTHWGAPQSYWWPYRGSGRFGGEYRYVPHLEFGQKGEYLTDRLTDEAIRVMDQASQRKQPFFLYLAHHAPHTPIEAPADEIDYFQQRLRPEMHHQHPVYAAMVKSLDRSVGRVLARLKELQLEENTLVIFTSDNGGYIGSAAYGERTLPVTNNFPLRSGKSSLYEGGLRVPLIVRWPGKSPSGAICNEPVVLTDWYPTLLNHLGLSLPKPLDGVDIGRVLENPTVHLERDALYFHYPHYYHAPATTPCGSVRVGNWKLIEWFEDQRVELYDLASDPGEEQDLAASQVDRVQSLRTQLHDWRSQVGAAMPTRRR